MHRYIIDILDICNLDNTKSSLLVISFILLCLTEESVTQAVVDGLDLGVVLQGV